MKINPFAVLLCLASVGLASAKSTKSLAISSSRPSKTSDDQSETSSSASISPTSSTNVNPGVYHPPIPASYKGCAYDPYNSSNSIVFFSENGIPFVNKHGHAVLSSNPNITNLPTYHFVAVAGAPAGVFDLISNTDNKYITVYADGKVGFTRHSSKGQNAIGGEEGGEEEDDENLHVTTIWSVDCNGTLLAGIIGGPQFRFGISQDGRNELWAQNASPSLQKRGLFSFLGKAASKVLKIVKVGFVPFLDLLALLHARTDLGIDQPRCDNPALSPVVKWDARPPSKNGCGSPPFTDNYQPFAGAKCCDNHDFCFDNCDQTFLGCNQEFSDCTFNSCDTAFPGSDIGSLMEHLGCEIMAGSFTFIVESEIGRILFDSATSDRCTCCQKGQKSCPSGCADLQTDPQNCGTCGNVCPSGECENSMCTGGCDFPRVCGSFVFGACGGSSACVCYTTASGTGGCSTDYLCAGLADCSSDADCGPAGFCAVQTCCGRNVCIPAACPNPAGRLLRLTRRGKWVEASTLVAAHWEA